MLTEEERPRQKRGLAAASEETRQRVARKGGTAPHQKRGLAATNTETRLKVSKAGGEERAKNDIEGLIEAGKLGGAVTKGRYGTEFYREMGRKSGEARRTIWGRKNDGVIQKEYYYHYNNHYVVNNPEEERRRSRRRSIRGGTGQRDNTAGAVDSWGENNVNIVTADGWGSRNSGMEVTSTKPRIRSKWGSRTGETIARSKAAAGVKGDREVEEWLSQPEQSNTYLADYRDSSK
jgi:general stress protein YciG